VIDILIKMEVISGVEILIRVEVIYDLQVTNAFTIFFQGL